MSFSYSYIIFCIIPGFDVNMTKNDQKFIKCDKNNTYKAKK